MTVSAANELTPTVQFYWRPGCGFCAALFRDLSGLGIEFEPHNIWEDPVAAARVREVARGNETVPTIIVGATVLVNPVAGDVVRALADLATA